jgi:GDP/UDP-N,N'-diacetylbacillosamine 2-epimerase (hydrolysing)
MTRRRIVYLSGTRADFGLMRAALRRIAGHPALRLEIAVTGMHLAPEFGNTVAEIEASGLPIAARIPTDVGARDRAGMARAVAQTLLGVTALLQRDPPDALLLLGDRGEMLAGATAALHMGVPSVHIHGGERSGTVDEPMRHAISKLACYHFAATEESRARLIAMGEEPARTFVTGAPGLDDIGDALRVDRASAVATLGLDGARPYVLIVFHPVVQQAEDAGTQARALLEGLRAAGAGSVFDAVWLAPNADAGSGSIEQAIAGQPWLRRITHLERPQYLGALRHAAALLGNSSSGIIEAASFATPVLNLGQRQNLRERNAGTLDVALEPAAIAAALRAALEQPRGAAHNVYGDGDAGARIAELLAKLPQTPALLQKTNRF